MRKRNRQLIELSRRLDALGVTSYADQEALRRIEMTLHRWAERECNGEVERDEQTGKTFSVCYHNDSVKGPSRYAHPVADKERGALRRLAAIMSKYPRLWYYHQGDPRGCALYIGEWCRLPEVDPKDASLKDARTILDGYYTRGVAVCL